MTIWYLPIQPFEERYTAQWWEWFPEEFERQGVAYKLVLGDPLTFDIKVGTFLDANGSLHYQSGQLQQVAQLFHFGQVKNGDLFFVADIEFWGIESIRYLATLNGIKIKLCGFCHAGSYTREDFFEKCAPFAKNYERAWGSIFDMIFVGSEYHKKQLVSERFIPSHKIVVTGNPYDIEGTLSSLKNFGMNQNSGSYMVKRNRIICTNRPDPEKRPNITLEVFESMKRIHPSWEFMVTTGRKEWGTGDLQDWAKRLHEDGTITIRKNLSKLEYLALLADSKVMTGNSIEENFGYCILESLMVDTIPILPNAYSHPELVQNDERCLFHSTISQFLLIEQAMEKPFTVKQYAQKYARSLSKIVELLKNA